MTYIEAFILGLLQGLTEFLPVSSSGHLVLAQHLFGIKEQGVSFELLLHLGTLLAVFIYFRVRLLALIKALFDSSMVIERKMIMYIVIGTIPAGLAGITLKQYFESAYNSPFFTATMLLVTGGILLLTKWAPTSDSAVGLKASIIMGVGQAMAILPGISRSGSTIAFGLFGKVRPSEAAEFSFLLAIPAILGATVLEYDNFLQLQSSQIGQYVVGVIVAFVSGWAAVSILMSVVKKGKLEYFAYYCFVVGALGMYLFR